MSEFKLRLTHCEKVANAPSPLLGLPALDSEFCFLQIRRMIELVAFSSVLRDEDRYKRLREIQRQENSRDHGDHSRDWEAPEILRRLAQISPYCLPIPLKPLTRGGAAVLNFDRKNISVTHGRLIEIYGICGGFLHGKNPFNKDYKNLVENERKKYADAYKEIKKSLAYFRKLMWYHAAVSLEWKPDDDPKSPANPKAAWIVDFGADEEFTVNMTIAKANAE
jgi:hypothetical protein